MKFLDTIKDNDIFEKPEFANSNKYKKRVTVKAIIKNTEGYFAFITNDIHKYILLSGGGAESEDLKKEVNRECEEEMSFSVKNIEELFGVKEFRNRKAKEYETVCFLGYIDKKSEEDKRIDDEKNNNLKVVWLEKEEALNILKKQVERLREGKIEFYNTAFNILRDYRFFKEYAENEK
jgi:ADP-ribose pyrophosphatase YjhB (NUDIX family)